MSAPSISHFLDLANGRYSKIFALEPGHSRVQDAIRAVAYAESNFISKCNAILDTMPDSLERHWILSRIFMLRSRPLDTSKSLQSMVDNPNWSTTPETWLHFEHARICAIAMLQLHDFHQASYAINAAQNRLGLVNYDPVNCYDVAAISSMAYHNCSGVAAIACIALHQKAPRWHEYVAYIAYRELLDGNYAACLGHAISVVAGKTACDECTLRCYFFLGIAHGETDDANASVDAFYRAMKIADAIGAAPQIKFLIAAYALGYYRYFKFDIGSVSKIIIDNVSPLPITVVDIIRDMANKFQITLPHLSVSDSDEAGTIRYAIVM